MPTERVEEQVFESMTDLVDVIRLLNRGLLDENMRNEVSHALDELQVALGMTAIPVSS